MMDRVDYDRYSFNYMERERLYLHFLRHWNAVIDLLGIDLVISAVAPHRVYDYVLYLVCKDRGIPFITFHYSFCIERVFATRDINTIGDKFDAGYRKYLQQRLTVDNLPEEIRREYDRMAMDYTVAAPSYMKKHDASNRRYSNPFFMVRFFLKKWISVRKKGHRTPLNAMMKVRNRSVHDEHQPLPYLLKVWVSATGFRKKLRETYQAYVTEPVPGEKFIFVPLHYQPEATTSPAGDIFVNQFLVVQTLLTNTPDDYYIYIKEHPQQFQSHLLGYTSRILEFYSDLAANPRVRFMPLEWNSFRLMKDASAVATVTGTVGWEAIRHQIPVIVFGVIWYEKCPGVLRVTDSESAKRITPFVEHFEYDENSLLAYLMSFADNSTIAYHYRGRKEMLNLDKDICADRLILEICRVLSE